MIIPKGEKTMRNEERVMSMGMAEQIAGDGVLELPEAEEKKFKFKSIFTGDAAKKGLKKIGARNIVIALSVLLIGAAVYVNWQLFGAPSKTVDKPAGEVTEVDQNGEKQAAADFFASADVSRKQARDEAKEVLQSVVDDKEALDAAKEKALADIAAMAANIELEANIEQLIKAKGFEECVAVINGDKATVVVKSEGLKPNKLSQILEIVYKQANILPENVTITEKN